MPRYVILKHETAGGVHFDLMLELAAALRTWSLAQAPLPGVEIHAKALPDHRLAYLDYEGPISGSRGTVTRWDRGTYHLEQQSKSDLILQLDGERLKGRASLAKKQETENEWVFLFLT
jgi:hypothetical protein